MLTMRPKPRSIMPSTVALMSSIGASMFASRALIQISRSQSRKSPGGGPPALLTRMSGFGHASSAAARPSGVAISPTTTRTLAPVSRRISSAVASRVSRVRAVIVTETPSRARLMAHALPRPLLAAQTSALRPLIPRSIVVSSGPILRSVCRSPHCNIEARPPWRCASAPAARTESGRPTAISGQYRGASPTRDRRERSRRERGAARPPSRAPTSQPLRRGEAAS